MPSKSKDFQNSKKEMETKIMPMQWFIQVILMPGRRHQKLDLPIEFSNSNLHKILFQSMMTLN